MNTIKNTIKENKKFLIITILILTIFNLLSNYNYFISLCNKTKPIIYTKEKIIIEQNEYIIENINKDVNIIEIEFEEIPNYLSINYTDEQFKNYNHFNLDYQNDNITNKILHIPLSTNGKINNLKFNIYEGIISKITINPNIKFKIDIYTSTFIFLFSIIFYIILKNNKKLELNNQNQKYITIYIISLILCICIGFYLNFYNNIYEFGNIYEYSYVNAIMNNKLNLDFPIDENLLNSDNPYDTSNRNFIYLWDASFYKGKYYCYFGIWPIITMFIPFKIITGNYLTSPLACLIYSIIGIIGTYILYHNIIKKYFKNINFQTYIISFIFIIFGSKILWCMHRPFFYEVVSLAAYSHIIFGLYLVLFKNKRLSNFIGYLLLSSAVLCRPTALFASILIIPKILNDIKNKKWKLLDYLLLIIPYLIFGIITMYINYIRFDSIFEFGISYQLTTNNLYNAKSSLLNAIYGSYQYLFNNINISLIPFKIITPLAKVPYITDINVENIGGGTITTSIIGIIILFIPKIFKYIKEKEVKIYIIISLLTASFIMMFSSSIGALIGRYMLDFNYLFYFTIVILSLYTIKNSKYKQTNNIYLILCFISILLNLFLSGAN